MTIDLDTLIEKTRNYTMTEEQAAAQRRSFAFGNVAIENPAVTMEMVIEVERRMEAESGEPRAPRQGRTHPESS